MTETARDYDSLRADLVARSGKLSKRLSQVARFFLNHPENIALNTLSRLTSAARPASAISAARCPPWWSVRRSSSVLVADWVSLPDFWLRLFKTLLLHRHAAGLKSV